MSSRIHTLCTNQNPLDDLDHCGIPWVTLLGSSATNGPVPSSSSEDDTEDRQEIVGWDVPNAFAPARSVPGTSPRAHPGRDYSGYESIGPPGCVPDDDGHGKDEGGDGEDANGEDDVSFSPIDDYDSEDDFDRPGAAGDDDKPATIVLPRLLPRPTTTSQKPTNARKDAHRYAVTITFIAPCLDDGQTSSILSSMYTRLTQTYLVRL